MNSFVDELPIKHIIKENFKKFLAKYPLNEKESQRFIKLTPKKRIGFLFGKVIHIASTSSVSQLNYYVRLYNIRKNDVKAYAKNNDTIESIQKQLQDDDFIVAENMRLIVHAIEDKYKIIYAKKEVRRISEIILNLIIGKRHLL